MRFLDGLRGGSYLLRNETPADVKMEDGDIILAIGFPLSSGRLLCLCRCDSVSALSRPDNGKCYQPPVHVILAMMSQVGD